MAQCTLFKVETTGKRIENFSATVVMEVTELACDGLLAFVFFCILTRIGKKVKFFRVKSESGGEEWFRRCFQVLGDKKTARKG